jgi:hypothetical protein
LSELIDTGCLIEAGWIALRILAIAPDAPQVQLDEMRTAFFAGAQHLFGTILSTLDRGGEPTERDLHRLELIHQELENFVKDFNLRHLPSKGAA